MCGFAGALSWGGMVKKVCAAIRSFAAVEHADDHRWVVSVIGPRNLEMSLSVEQSFETFLIGVKLSFAWDNYFCRHKFVYFLSSLVTKVTTPLPLLAKITPLFCDIICKLPFKLCVQGLAVTDAQWTKAGMGNLTTITGRKINQIYPKILPLSNYEEEWLILTDCLSTCLTWSFVLARFCTLTW